MNIIYITGILSLIIQIITGIFDYYILNLQITPNLKLLRELLFVEFIVQLVEGCFYIWMVMNFSKISNINLNINVKNVKIFQSMALWADAFYKSKCPSVCLSVCVCVHV